MIEVNFIKFKMINTKNNGVDPLSPKAKKELISLDNSSLNTV
jgi:hypothetical protein